MKEKLKEVCIAQAKYLLEEFGEFFPIAFGITQTAEVIPIMTYGDDEHPSPAELINQLEKVLQISNQQNNFECVAICVDVLTIPPYLKEKIDALEIRIDSKNENRINYYVPYKKGNKGEIILLEEFSSDGSFDFYISNL